MEVIFELCGIFWNAFALWHNAVVKCIRQCTVQCFLFRSFQLMQFTKFKRQPSLQGWFLVASTFAGQFMLTKKTDVSGWVSSCMCFCCRCCLYSVQINIRKTWTEIGSVHWQIVQETACICWLHAIISNKNALAFDLKIIAKMECNSAHDVCFSLFLSPVCICVCVYW